MSTKSEKSLNELESPATEVTVEIPERHVFEQCPRCRHIVDQNKIAANFDVCPRCGAHLRIGARRRLEITVDGGSFEEWDEHLATTDFLHFPGYSEKLERARKKSGELDAVICGRASIGGQPCAIFIMNGEFMMGSMGIVVGEKICRLFERAQDLKLPVVGFTVSGGARMQEGATSLMQMAKVSGAVRRHSESGLAYFVVLTDPTTGGVTASFAMEADVTLAEPGALIGFAGPRVVEQTIHKHLPEGFQHSEFQLKHGFVDLIVKRDELPATIAELLSLYAGKIPADGSPHEIHFKAQGLPASLIKIARDAIAHTSGESSIYERVKYVRSSKHPTPLELLKHGCKGFIEMHGDRCFGDDEGVVAGVAWTESRIFTVIMTERGKSTHERLMRNFGAANPEGYRKANRMMKQAEKFGRPVVCLIDTSGAYPGIVAEERGQGEAIASDIVEMSGLGVPEVACIVGEGGSGGALALAVANKVLMFSNAVYSVVSPESCATILWKTPKNVEDAAAALHLTAEDLLDLGIVDQVVDDAGKDIDALSKNLFSTVETTLDELSELSASELEKQRYRRFREIGGGWLCSL